MSEFKRPPELLRCQFCRQEFKRQHPVGPVPHYCTAACRQRAFEQRRIDTAVERILKERESA